MVRSGTAGLLAEGCREPSLPLGQHGPETELHETVVVHLYLLFKLIHCNACVLTAFFFTDCMFQIRGFLRGSM